MQARLRAMPRGPQVAPVGWDDPDLNVKPASTVLAANMPAPLTTPAAFLTRCKSWASQNIVWVVPAQIGPRGLCLAGCLPREWHGEDETPGVDLVLAGLGADQPHLIDATDWTFSLITSDLTRLASYLADRLRWSSDDPRRSPLMAHLAMQATPTPGGYRLSVRRRSAVLVWKTAMTLRASRHRSLLASTCIWSVLFATTAAAQTDIALGELVVTATGRPEPRSQIPGTVQIISRETIERSSAKSVTDLLAENAVGFFSEWTPGQTSINIRGGATDGQGKDFRSQVLVLMNGRRAGTANLSKFSPADIERIEVVRGPSSVIYGSQNIGGVINIILKTGRTAPGTLLEAGGGSWGLLQGKAQTGGVYDAIDWYTGISGGQRDDYRSGRGGSTMVNTGWKRLGLTGALGLQISPNHRVDVSLHNDGVYDVGFRGSGANTISKEDRYNSSVDMTYNGQLPGGMLRWMLQGYAVQDVDNFRWASPIIRGGNGLPAPGTSSDHNRRQLDVFGTRFQPRATLWQGNELLLGWDWESSQLRSNRHRIGVPGNPLAQVSPQDNNQSENVNALYIEDSQKFFDDRMTVRGGVRRTFGTTSFEWTPNLVGQRPRDVDYQATTYSIGATFAATQNLAFRVGYSTGFRAPTATELAADFNTLGGGRIFGSPSLSPETSRQVEAGVTYAAHGWRFDTALFQNVISDRIITRLRPGVANTSDYANNSGDVVVRGVELQFDADILKLANYADPRWRWSVFANGNYNFDMEDRGAAATANTMRVERMYQYQAAVGTRFGQTGGQYDWSIQVQGVLRGPMWYNTEENLVASAEPFREFIHRKSPFWVWNVRGEVEIAKGVKLFALVNNLFNVNEHPIFIGLDQQPYKLDSRFANGGFGTSMPGLEIQAGLQARF
jgi:vitamin B12 transporter